MHEAPPRARDIRTMRKQVFAAWKESGHLPDQTQADGLSTDWGGLPERLVMSQFYPLKICVVGPKGVNWRTPKSRDC